MLERQKEIVVEVGKYLFERGFTQLSGGNISVRDPQTNLVAIKPSGVAYGVMKPEDKLLSILTEMWLRARLVLPSRPVCIPAYTETDPT